MKRILMLIMLTCFSIASKAESLLIQNHTGCQIVLYFNIADNNLTDIHVGPLVLPPFGNAWFPTVDQYYPFIGLPTPTGATPNARFTFYWVSTNGCNRDYDFPPPTAGPGTSNVLICPKSLCNGGNDVTRTLINNGGGNFQMIFQ